MTNAVKKYLAKKKKVTELNDSEIAEAVKEFEEPTICISSKDELSQIIDCNAGRLVDGMEKWVEN